MITVRLTRMYQDSDGTIGVMSVGKYSKWMTIEPPWLDNRPNVSCIPEGSYLLKKGYYNKGGYPVYEVQDVPDRTLIKIHAANFACEVSGCIAPGYDLIADISEGGRVGVGNSRNALQDFHAHLNNDAEAILVVSNMWTGENQ